jgi:hypothetical protein
VGAVFLAQALGVSWSDARLRLSGDAQQHVAQVGEGLDAGGIGGGTEQSPSCARSQYIADPDRQRKEPDRGGQSREPDYDRTPRGVRRRADVTLTSRTDVYRLLHSLRRLSGAPGRILVPGLTDSVRDDAEVSLNAALHDGGCTMGGLVMSLGVVGYLGYLWAFHGSSLPVAGFHPVSGGVAVAVVAAGVGKALGLLLARVRLVSRLKAVEPHLPEAA